MINFSALQVRLPPRRRHGEENRGQEVFVNFDPSRHRSGGTSGQGKDLHLEEALQIPQLDRNQHKGKQTQILFLLIKALKTFA